MPVDLIQQSAVQCVEFAAGDLGQDVNIGNENRRYMTCQSPQLGNHSLAPRDARCCKRLWPVLALAALDL
jgi:hypothetical protein